MVVGKQIAFQRGNAPHHHPAFTKTITQLSHSSSATPDHYVSILALLTSLVNQVLTSCVSSQKHSGAPWLMERSDWAPGVPAATTAPQGFNNPEPQQARLLFSPADSPWLTVHMQVLKCPTA